MTASSAMGVGTTFKVLLPRFEGRVATGGGERSPALEGCERLLVVDDDPQLVELARECLGRLGYRVAAFTSSLEALAAFRADRGFDLVVSDVTMPHMDGVALARELRALRPDVPILLLTGWSERLDADTASALGVELLGKPVSPADLSRAVRRWLDAAKAR